MKKLLISSLIFSSAFAFAETVEKISYTGKLTTATGGSRQDIYANNTADVKYDVELISNKNADGVETSKFRGSSARTVQRVVVTDNTSASGYGYANIAGSWNIDANIAETLTATDDSKYTFISDKLELVAGTYTFKNTASKDATVYLKFGELRIDGTNNGQDQTISFNNITANVETTKTYLDEQRDGNSILHVADSANVTWVGEIRAGKKGSTTHNGRVNVEGTLVSETGLKIFSGTSTVSGTLITNGDFYIDGNGTLENHNGTFQMKSMNIYGKFLDKSVAPTNQLLLTNVTSGYKNSATDYKGGTFTQDITTGENTGVRFAGRSNALRYGSKWTINEKVVLGGDTTTETVLYVDNLSSINFVTSQDQTARIEFLGNASLTLAKENAITNNNGTSEGWAKLCSVGAITGKGNKLYIQADQTFHSIEVNKAMGIILENDAKLMLVGDCENTLFVESGQRLSIFNFKEGSVYVGLNYDEYIIANRLLVFEGTSQDTQLDNVYVSATGWLTALPAVPEPAEWAMIFGGLALGFAIYRKRK